MMKRMIPEKIKLFGLILFSAIFCIPFVAYAITFQDIVFNLLFLISMIVPVLIGLAVAVFFFGIVRYILSAGKPDQRQEGAKYMLYGVVALFVMISIWGLVAVLQFTIFQGDSGTPFQGIPQIY